MAGTLDGAMLLVSGLVLASVLLLPVPVNAPMMPSRMNRPTALRSQNPTILLAPRFFRGAFSSSGWCGDAQLGRRWLMLPPWLLISERGNVAAVRSS
ncbi:hypothetical protein BG418_21700 [Streptomyces sp. CBMA152]|nr:hypothetical protein [Streptomyces sp. CBMA152]